MANEFKETITVPKKDYDALILIAKKLLAGANLCMEEQALVQPFFSIVKANAEIIGRLNLFELVPNVPLVKRELDTYSYKELQKMVLDLRHQLLLK